MPQAIQNIDTLIIGQGLAGSLLAMKLIQQRQKVIIVCDEAAASASRVAAGLFNPITGQRFVLQPQASQIITAARQYYQQLEIQFGQTYFHAKPMLRILQQHKEQQYITKRQRDANYAPYLGQYIASYPNMSTPFGLCEQQQTGYLDINSLLNSLRHHFKQQNSYIPQRFAYDELNITENGIRWRNIQAQRIIFCQGFMDQSNPYFQHLPFQPAKGEILSFSSTSSFPERIINGGKWLLPWHDGSYKTGATYTHNISNTEASTQGQAECLLGLQKLFDRPIDINIIQQQAGIRPNTLDKHPFIGFHRDHNSIGIFNGFGSKGSMLIPHYAQAFAQHMINNTAIPIEADIVRILDKKDTPQAKQPRIALTERVHQALSPLLSSDTLAIDATTGNGHDTLFLAQAIGSQGHVFGFDMQALAINATLKKLVDAGYSTHTTLYCTGHEHMLQHIPESLHGKINIIMFNLGYLPHTDKTIITQTHTTIIALKAALQLLAADGHISILAYPGHQGGAQETKAIKAWLAQLPGNSFKTITHHALHPTPHSPVWFEVIRLSPITAH